MSTHTSPNRRLSRSACLFLFLFSLHLMGIGCPKKVLTKEEKARIVVLNSPFQPEAESGWFGRSLKQLVEEGAQLKSPQTNDCMALQTTSYWHANCVYPHFAKGSKVQRIAIIHTLAIFGKPGHGTLNLLLNSTRTSYRLLLGDHILAYSSIYATIPNSFLASYYTDSRRLFRQALERLPQSARLNIAFKLIDELKLKTRADVTKEFRGYLRLPSTWLWSQIFNETQLQQALTKLNITDCTLGPRPEAPKYYKALFELQRFYVHWQKLTLEIKKSNVRLYMQALRDLHLGKNFVNIPRLNQKSLREAANMVQEHAHMKKTLNLTIQNVKHPKRRQQLHTWFEQIVTQGNQLLGNP